MPVIQRFQEKFKWRSVKNLATLRHDEIELIEARSMTETEVKLRFARVADRFRRVEASMSAVLRNVQIPYNMWRALETESIMTA